MRSYNHFIRISVIAILLIIAGVNLYLEKSDKGTDREYLVEISRLSESVRRGDYDTAGCKYVQKVTLCQTALDCNAPSRNDYTIRQIDGKLYRFEYVADRDNNIWIINLGLGIMAILLMAIIFYIKRRIIRPFNELENVPYELSKGNLIPAIEEEKSKYFGRFVWGLNMLRENIEERRESELQMHRDKKLMMLSLTHDIKTPLSVIKLNAQAIQKGLFKDEERKVEAAAIIDSKVNEIESYVSQITEASKDDFLDLKVVEGDFYLSQVVDAIVEGYRNKLDISKTELTVEEYKDCILYGDCHRLIEVMQNIMENDSFSVTLVVRMC